MSLLHAVTFVLTVLVFVVRLRCALAAPCTGKRRSIRQQGTQQESCEKLVGRSSQQRALTQVELLLSDPNYKRDPDIDVDNEQIGYEPML